MSKTSPSVRPVRYRLAIESAAAHLLRVELSLEHPAAQGEVLSLPAWIPGSYMIREFAKNIVSLTAEQAGEAVPLRKLDKHTWRTGPLPDAPLRVTAIVYAWDLSVRCAHVDASHAFFNGTQVFLQVQGRELQPHLVELVQPEGEAFADWKVATTLKPARGVPGAAKQWGFGVYRADDYDSLIDHPVEMGTFQTLRFDVAGVPHQMVVTGRARFDEQRLRRDLARICEWHIELFGKPAPFDRYLFMTMAVGDAYGGLEHRASTALLCSRNDLPVPGVHAMDERYRTFLGLCSHEYFHAWNVKRIKPAAFIPYALAQEGYTRLLWVFEGFTSYYDDLALIRTRTITQQDYFAILARTISGVERGSGRLKQSTAESSFDAWIKYYRQDENSPNAVVSYYTKGALIAAGLDLTIRAASEGKRSLDDVMRHLWREYALKGRGVGEDDMPAIIKTATGVDVRREIAAWAEGNVDVPFERLLKPFGVTLTRSSGGLMSALGIKTKAEAGALKLQHVLDGGAMQAAGASAGDELVALDGLRVSASNLESLLVRYRTGEQFELMVFRRDELLRLQVTLTAPRADECQISLAARSTETATTLREGWLG